MGGWILLGIVLLLACLLAKPAWLAPMPTECARTRWIRGLDGELHELCSPAVIEEVQKALKEKNLYSGDANGELDMPTMQAVGQFQKANHLTVSGVPSRSTQELLLEK